MSRPTPQSTAVTLWCCLLDLVSPCPGLQRSLTLPFISHYPALFNQPISLRIYKSTQLASRCSSVEALLPVWAFVIISWVFLLFFFFLISCLQEAFSKVLKCLSCLLIAQVFILYSHHSKLIYLFMSSCGMKGHELTLLSFVLSPQSLDLTVSNNPKCSYVLLITVFKVMTWWFGKHRCLSWTACRCGVSKGAHAH